jgi:hypothetical protein
MAQVWATGVWAPGVWATTTWEGCEAAAITGDVTVTLTVAGTMDLTRHADIAGDVVVTVAVAGTMDFTRHADIAGDVTVTLAVAGTMLYRRPAPLVLAWASHPKFLLAWGSHPKLILARVSMDDFLYLDNPYVIKWTAKEYNTSNVLEAADGYTVTGRISLTASGAVIGECSATLTELVGEAGTYSGTITSSSITTDLTAYVGQTVFEIVEDSDGNGEKSKRLTVAYRSVEVEDGTP